MFRIPTFTRWMRKTGLADHALLEAVDEMNRGLVDADLGAHLVKKRIPLRGRGKRGGARAIVATDQATRWFFLYGFAKNERVDVAPEELIALQQVARELVGFDDRQLARALTAGEIVEICSGNHPT